MRDGWKTDLEGAHVPLAGIGELRGEADEHQIVDAFEQWRVPHNRWATAANRQSHLHPAKGRPAFSPRATRRRPRPRCTRRLKVPGRDIRRQALHRSRRPFIRGTKTGNQLSRAHSRRKFAEDQGDRQALEPQQPRWRKHRASASHPAKDRGEGGDWTENFASGSASRSKSGRRTPIRLWSWPTARAWSGSAGVNSRRT